MTQELEQTMRNVYNGLPKEELVNHCIELDRRIEFLEFRIACLDSSDALHETAKAIEKEIKGADMTKDLEHELRYTYGNMDKDYLIEIIIELQKRNENLREACVEVSNALDDAVKEMREIRRVNGLLS